MFPLMQYGREWRMHRRAFHQTFNPEKMQQHQALQLKAARRMLYDFLIAPDGLTSHAEL